MPVPKGVNPEKYDRCVDEVKEKGSADNAYAVCATSLKRHEIDWSDIEKSIQNFNGMLLLRKAGVHQPLLPEGRKKDLAGESTMGSHVRAQAHSQGKPKEYHREMSHIHARTVAREIRSIKPKLPD
jgi:hypothetical protein